MKVLLTHVPYGVRGGEDIHVESLARAYRAIGVEPVLYPASRVSQATLGVSARSLLLTASDSSIEEAWTSGGFNFLHLHNAFPDLGPRFFRWLIRNKIPSLMTVHNHRMYCTNGLALRDGRICKDCKGAKTGWRGFIRNCNGSLAKSAYHALAITQMRRDHLYQRAVSKFLAPSPYIEAELLSLGIPAERIIRLVNPVETDNFAFSVSAHDFDAAYAGRLSIEKGIDRLLRVAESAPDLKFVILGDGPLRSTVENAAIRLSNLTFLGPRPGAEVRRIIRRTRIGVLPSICNEILPTFVLECYASGIRCVVPDLESTRWLAEPPFPGFTAEVSGHTGLLHSLRRALAAAPIDASERATINAVLGFDRYHDQLRQIVASFD